jgi:hypothetical protein
MAPCPYCEATERVLGWETFTNGTKHIRSECAGCGKWIEWAKQTPENLAIVGPRQ